MRPRIPHSHSIISHYRNLLLHQDFSREGCGFTVSLTDDLLRLMPLLTDRSRRVGGDSNERHLRNAALLAIADSAPFAVNQSQRREGAAASPDSADPASAATR